MAAKVERPKKGSGLPMPVEKYDNPTHMSINMDKMKGMQDCAVGDKCKMMVEGTITARREDEYSNTMDVDVTNMKYMGESDGDSEDQKS